jgi:hypothetical protein
MRTLRTNHQVILAFVNHYLPEARNPRDSLWFKGNKLYSYNSHLATIMPNNVLFINAELIQYSKTTTAHIADLRQTAEDLQYFIIPLQLQPNEVLNWYWDNIENMIAKCLRARINQYHYKRTILQTIDSIEQYVDYMQINRTAPEYLRKHDITKQLFKHQIL